MSKNDSRWFEPAGTPHLGTLLLIHGLNQSPSSMDLLASELAKSGYRTLRMALPGHDSTGRCGVKLEDWSEAVKLALKAVNDRSDSKPVYAIGFSLGGLLLTRALLESPEKAVSKVVLLAPALALHRKVRLTLLFRHLLPGSLLFPSIAPEYCRRHSAIPIGWYDALVEAQRSIDVAPKTHWLASTPGKVILAKDDELVSSAGLQSTIAELPIGHWPVAELNFDPVSTDLPNHIFTDPDSAGPTGWPLVIREITDVLLDN